MIYLDANASEILSPAALAAVTEALSETGNPSSVHGFGRRMRQILEKGRRDVADFFGLSPEGVVFTSGATEANATAIYALGRFKRIMIGATEHKAVEVPAKRFGQAVTVLPVEQNGVIRLSALEEALQKSLAESEGVLVCLMAANNETGVLHPIAEASALCRRYQALLHVDAAQFAGRLPFDFSALGLASATVSAHKLGGPQGVGAWLQAPLSGDYGVLLEGGGQERKRRGGMLPVALIAGFAAALTACDFSAFQELALLRDETEEALAAFGAVPVGKDAPRLANTSCLILPGASGEAQLIALDLAGFAVSSGAACSSGKLSQSDVLAAMGFGDAASQSIRISLPRSVKAADVRAFTEAYGVMSRRFRRG